MLLPDLEEEQLSINLILTIRKKKCISKGNMIDCIEVTHLDIRQALLAVFKTLCYTYKAIRGNLPDYMCDLTSVYNPKRCCLRLNNSSIKRLFTVHKRSARLALGRIPPAVLRRAPPPPLAFCCVRADADSKVVHATRTMSHTVCVFDEFALVSKEEIY